MSTDVVGDCVSPSLAAMATSADTTASGSRIPRSRVMGHGPGVEPDTVGSLEDDIPGMTWERAEATLRLVRTLRERHRVTA